MVLGSLTLGQVLCFREEAVLQALADGLPVYLYSPGLPRSPGNRALAAALSAGERRLRALGIRFTEEGRRQVITGTEARILRDRGCQPPSGAVLTPLAKEILEGSD